MRPAVVEGPERQTHVESIGPILAHAKGESSSEQLPVEGGARLIESGVDDVVMGEHHTCIKTKAGVISCAGKNELGQLGVMANGEVCDGSPCKTSF